MKKRLTPKMRTVICALMMLLTAVFMVISITQFVRIRDLQEKNAQNTEISASQSDGVSELAQIERKAHASELLALAQNAYMNENQRDFQGYMALLEGYADALSEQAAEIYEELENALRGKNND